MGVVRVAANAEEASTAQASAAREAARRPLTAPRLRTAAERPELVPDEVERRHEDDGAGLRWELVAPAVDAQMVGHDEVRRARCDRDDEEAHPLHPALATVLASAPAPGRGVVAR